MKKENYIKSIIIGRVNSIGLLKKSHKKGKDVEILFDIKSSTIEDSNQVIEYNSIKAYNHHARLVLKYLKSGDLCCVEGKLDKATKTIIAERIVFISSHEPEVLSFPKEINTL